MGPAGKRSRPGDDAGCEAPSFPAAHSTGAYFQRELHFQQREAAGELKFVYIVNDGSIENLVSLTNLKNIYSKQLPNMPKEYIARLVFERRHRSVSIVQPGGHTSLGGITYRVFPDSPCAQIGEIAFCAVSASQQVRGNGTRLMNWAKEYARTKDKLTHFLTCADNAAVGYFAKQGFSRTVTLPHELWQGYIKEYDGVTLMECPVHPKVDYSNLTSMIAAQRAELDQCLKHVSNSHVVHKALHRPGGNAGCLRYQDIPGVLQAGYKGPPSVDFDLAINGSIVPVTKENLQLFMSDLIDRVAKKDIAEAFREPVDAADVPDYYSVIKDPMDLQTMRERLKAGMYITLDIFLADMKRIWTNAHTYNAPDTQFYKDASTLNEFVETHIMEAKHYRSR